MRIADQLQVTCPVFYIDNVAEYAAGKGSYSDTDFPFGLPPFQDCWIEYIDAGLRVGFRVSTRVAMKDEVTPDGREVGWVSTWSPPYMQRSNGDLRCSDYDTDLFCGPAGETLGYVWRVEPPTDVLKKAIATFLAPPLLAISFMHCKNVRHVENTPPFNRARRRRGEREWLKFYTLEIDPMKEVLRREGRIDEVGLKRALHICRGHFATYSGAGLFGKYPGTFWRPSHVRGTAEAGVNVKDYSVKAPRH